MKKIVIAYRDNSLFQKYVPKFLQKIPLNTTIEKIIFPARTSGEEICSRLAIVKNIRCPFLYVSDRTCGQSFFEREDVINHSGYLDIIFEDQMLYGREFRDVFGELMPMLLVGGRPGKVNIVKNKLADHLPMSTWEKVDLAKKFDAWKCKNHDEFAKFIGELVRELYPETMICYYDTLREALSVSGENKDDVIVVDRHAGIYHEMSGDGNEDNIENWKHAVKLLCLPFANTYAHLIALGVGDQKKFDIENLYEKIFNS